MDQGSSSARKRRHKSFAGCWTCRARKVKCDERRPRCMQCDLKQLCCEGYEVRLRWMPPEAGSSGEQAFDEELETGSHRPQRSLVASESEESPLQLSDLDDIFTQIDSFQSRKSTSTLNSPSQDTQLFLSSFGVFDPSYFHNLNDTLPFYANDVPQDTPSLSSNSFTESWEPDTSHNNTSNDDDTHRCRQLSRNLWWKDDSSTIIHNPSPSPLPELERFLLNHYVHRVVHLFCVISYEKSPWKTIHLPRVLQSAGQLSLHGSTSTVRDALRNALLSISAFYLANDSRSRGCDSEAERWEEDAIMFRGRAIKLLKETVERSTPQSRPKYKELLATMLSMITINVMSGDTSTCGIHLDGAFRFMNHIKSSKSKYSSKARSLHRIYFYLRVIYDSTACRSFIASSNKNTNNPETPPSPEADFGTALSVGLLDKVDDDTSAERSVLNHVAAPRTQVGEYECVYGVPQSLLILLARTTDLIEQVTTSRHQTSCSSNFIPSDLNDQCDKLESDIIEWLPSPSSPESTTPSALIIQKTTLAFHNALIIYFAQHIPLLRHTYLRTHIDLVLTSIESIEAIKSESNIFSAPLYWPAFIAGSEAFDQALQDRFRSWYVRVEPYRLASVRSGIDVLRDVWKAGPGGKGRVTSQWRSVVQKTGAKLMLS
ncbi:hypothetical protein CC79DRAFT_1271400 [Sarocladium strictum]